jgi:iron(III) transport system ATP-binding protein
VYLGEFAQYEFKAGGVALKIFELNPRFPGAASPADLYAAVEPDDVVILAE